MKKFVSILLALAMILALSTTAFAAENTNLTISNSTGRTYNGYQLLNLTTSLKCEETHNHETGCYNYAYTVNEDYEDILQALAENAGEDDIIEFLAGKTSDANGEYGTLRAVADSIYRAILADTSITPDAPNLDGSDTIAQGYWLFADVTDLDDAEDKANSLVMVDTKGQDSLTITPKVGLPTLEKKVQDIADSTDSDITDNAWQDSADHDIGDTVPFQITVTMPENLAGYDTYQMIIHDTMSAGLTLDESSIVVTVDDEATEAFVYEAGENGKFTLTCENVLAIEGVDKDSIIVVTYNATLNEDAEIGAAGNPNTAYLEFSNNPYGTGTGETEKDKVIVFTYQLTINKTNPNGDPLKGATFTLYKWYQIAPATESTEATGEWRILGQLTGTDMTTFQWKGLDDGNYKLVEDDAPDGYNKMEDIEFTISATHNETPDTLVLTSLTSDFGEVKKENGKLTGVIEEDIENNTGSILPETGAKGTIMLITFSSVAIMVAVVFMVTRKKMSIYED